MPSKTVALPKRRSLDIDEDKVAQLEARAERAGGSGYAHAPQGATAPKEVPKAAPAAAEAPSEGPEQATVDVPAAFAELLEQPRGVARGRGTVADPRVRIVDGRAVRASTIHLPLELYDQVDAIARATGRSRSSIIEWALQKMLNQ